MASESITSDFRIIGIGRNGRVALLTLGCTVKEVQENLPNVIRFDEVERRRDWLEFLIQRWMDANPHKWTTIGSVNNAVKSIAKARTRTAA